MALTAQQTKFVNDILPLIQKYAPQYDILLPGVVLMQAVKESNFGTSKKAQHHNYFGLKYRPNRCPSSNGTFTDTSKEQNPDGSYKDIKDRWFTFPDMESGVKGYFDFTNIKSYAELKKETNPEKYLKVLEKVKYFTSLSYVETALKKYYEYGFDKYDKVSAVSSAVTSTTPKTNEISSQISGEFSNSPLATYKNIAPHKTSPRNHKIDTITIHCYVGQVTAKQGCDMFAKTSRKASCNYVVGKDGSIGLCVDEKDRSWCSSNAANDNRAITIEVASDTTTPYKVTNEALNALIELCADICRRNKIKKLLWKGDKSLIGQVDKQNMTVHRWFAAKACPGDYLYNLHGEIAERVNQKLGQGQVIIKENKEEKTPEISVKIPEKTGIKYIVQRGETLTIIAKKFSTTIEKIAEINKIADINKIRTGQTLIVRTDYEKKTVKTRGSNLNVRKGPSANESIIGKLRNGSSVNVLEKANEVWSKIEVNGLVGYVCSSYLN